MSRIALMHTVTFRAGQPGYSAERKRGTLEVFHDQKRYVYDVSGRDVKGREARQFVLTAWAGSLENGAHLTGRFPRYEIQ